MTLQDDIAQLKSSLTAAISQAKDEQELDAVRVTALGKKGSVSALLATLGTMAPEDRKTAGPAINGLNTEIAAAIDAKGAELKGAALNAIQIAEVLIGRI